MITKKEHETLERMVKKNPELKEAVDLIFSMQRNVNKSSDVVELIQERMRVLDDYIDSKELNMLQFHLSDIQSGRESERSIRLLLDHTEPGAYYPHILADVEKRLEEGETDFMFVSPRERKPKA